MNHAILAKSGIFFGIRKKSTVKIGNKKNVARYHGRYFPSPANFPRTRLFWMFSLSMKKPNTISSQASMTLTIRIAAEIRTRSIP